MRLKCIVSSRIIQVWCTTIYNRAWTDSRFGKMVVSAVEREQIWGRHCENRGVHKGVGKGWQYPGEACKIFTETRVVALGLRHWERHGTMYTVIWIATLIMVMVTACSLSNGQSGLQFLPPRHPQVKTLLENHLSPVSFDYSCLNLFDITNIKIGQIPKDQIWTNKIFTPYISIETLKHSTERHKHQILPWNHPRVFHNETTY